MEQNAIVILTGSAEGKSAFDRIAKQHGYWVWNLNPKNVLGVASRSMGWHGKRNDKYYAYIDELSALVNEYWNFDEDYFLSMIEKFNEDDKANLLVLHHCNPQLVEKLCDEKGAFTLHIDNENSVPPVCDKFIPIDSGMEETILSVLRILVS